MIDEIDDLIISILREYKDRWPVDITDRVFLAIEDDQNKLSRYQTYADGEYATANSQIGAFIADYTGLTAIGVNAHPKSTLIHTYSLLAQVGKKG